MVLMARSIGMAADATVFRAVITKKYPGWEEFTEYEGPYGSHGAAQGRVTFWVNHMAIVDEDTFEPTGESNASGYVESGSVAWTRHGKDTTS